jgi:predicted RNase H-like HicB family nuclease
MSIGIELEREDDGRWIAEVPALAGVMAYGASRDEALRAVQTLALRVIADRLEQGEPVSEAMLSAFHVAA